MERGVFEEHPGGGAIIISPSFKIPDLPPPCVQGMMRCFAPCCGCCPVAPQRFDSLTRVPENLEEMTNTLYLQDGKLSLRTGLSLVNLALECQSKFSSYRAPFLALHGTADAYTDYQGSCDLFNQCQTPAEHKRLVLVEDAYHVLHMDLPSVQEMFWSTLNTWMKEHLDSVSVAGPDEAPSGGEASPSGDVHEGEWLFLSLSMGDVL
eukprot:EC693099.1.p1 GENE.EC693099.1~~EC693099.1.p1  ORF type:complete len:225 (+),score=46.02 EC693099.1:56-676(+)